MVAFVRTRSCCGRLGHQRFLKGSLSGHGPVQSGDRVACGLVVGKGVVGGHGQGGTATETV
ncbi:MAG: hypothetical protein KDA75_17215, partial [Planctomycetaceae bacterium]|nr:hypothetical protein [Planctomycetaceae bacterium]